MNWEDPPYNDEEAYSELCAKSMPSDFYFSVSESDDFTHGYVFISLVPKVFFHKEGYMWDQSMFLDHILPDDFDESMESIWESPRSVEEIRADLLARGFEENEAFTKLAFEDLE
jgi:hypothetical protein